MIISNFVALATLALGDLSFRQIIFVIANLVIPIGYVFIALFVLPLLPISGITRLGARAFFILCALTHVDQAAHTLLTPDETMGKIAGELHMLLIHVPQSIAVWVFALGFFVDLRRLRSERGSVEVAVKSDD